MESLFLSSPLLYSMYFYNISFASENWKKKVRKLLKWIEGTILTFVKLTLWAVPEERQEEMTWEAPLVESSGREEVTQQMARWREMRQADQLGGDTRPRRVWGSRVNRTETTSHTEHRIFLPDRADNNSKHDSDTINFLLVCSLGLKRILQNVPFEEFFGIYVILSLYERAM